MELIFHAKNTNIQVDDQVVSIILSRKKVEGLTRSRCQKLTLIFN